MRVGTQNQVFPKRLCLSSKLDDVTPQMNVIVTLNDILFWHGENEVTRTGISLFRFWNNKWIWVKILIESTV